MSFVAVLFGFVAIAFVANCGWIFYLVTFGGVL